MVQSTFVYLPITGKWSCKKCQNLHKRIKSKKLYRLKYLIINSLVIIRIWNKNFICSKPFELVFQLEQSFIHRRIDECYNKQNAFIVRIQLLMIMGHISKETERYLPQTDMNIPFLDMMLFQIHWTCRPTKMKLLLINHILFNQIRIRRYGQYRTIGILFIHYILLKRISLIIQLLIIKTPC